MYRSFLYLSVVVLFMNLSSAVAVDVSPEYKKIEALLFDLSFEKLYEKEKRTYKELPDASARAFILYARLIRTVIPVREDWAQLEAGKKWILQSELSRVNLWPIAYRSALQVYRKRTIAQLIKTQKFTSIIDVVKYMEAYIDTHKNTKISDALQTLIADNKADVELQVIEGLYLDFEKTMAVYTDTKLKPWYGVEDKTSVEAHNNPGDEAILRIDKRPSFEVDAVVVENLRHFYGEYARTPRILSQEDLDLLAQEIISGLKEGSIERKYIEADLCSILGELHGSHRYDGDIRDLKKASTYLRRSLDIHDNKFSYDSVTNWGTLVNYGMAERGEALAYYKWMVYLRDKADENDVWRFRGITTIIDGRPCVMTDGEARESLEWFKNNGLQSFMSTADVNILWRHSKDVETLEFFKKKLKGERISEMADEYLEKIEEEEREKKREKAKK